MNDSTRVSSIDQTILAPQGQGMLVIIDPSVTDSQSLARGAIEGATVFQLDPEGDGIVQIADYLHRKPGFTSLHLLCHGAPASLYIGSSKLEFENLATYTSLLQKWGRGLGGDREILLYGCQVAKTSRGREFVKVLSEMTNAKIAASMDLTGNAALGGTWQLAYQTGEIKANLALQDEVMARYAAVLIDIANGDVAALLTAIETANSGGDATINLAANGTYELTGDGFFPNNPGNPPTLPDPPVNGTSGLPEIEKTITINGNGSILKRSDSTPKYRFFYIDGTLGAKLTLNDITLENGRAQIDSSGGDSGGAIFNDQGTVEINRSTIRNNEATDDGGAIANINGTLTINNSTINANKSLGTTTDGGVIDNDGANAKLILNNSTLSGNEGDQGGAIRNRGGTVTVNNSTLTQNIGRSGGGGIFNSSGSVTVKNSIIAGNTGTGAPDLSGAITGAANNLISNTSGTSGSIGTGSDIVDTNPIAQVLNTTLAANGVLERSPFTHALVDNSPAIDKGDSSFTQDQRSAFAVGTPDIGAYESSAKASGEVKEAANIIADDTGSVDFGSTLKGTSLQKTFTIASTGTLPLNLNNLTLPNGFSVVGDFPSTIAATSDPNTPQTQTFTVRLDATTVGTFSGDLSFPTNDTDNNPYNFNLKGTVVDPNVKLQVFANSVLIPDDTGVFQFGMTPKDDPVVIAFTVKNTDSSNAFDLSNLKLPEGFSLMGNFPASVAASGETTFNVKLDAALAGNYNGELSFQTTDTSVSNSTYNFNIGGLVDLGSISDPPGTTFFNRLQVNAGLKRFTTGSQGGGNLKLQLADNSSDRITQISIVYLNANGDRTLTDVLFTALPARFRPNGFGSSRQSFILEQVASNQSFTIELQTIDGEILTQEVSFSEISTGRFQVEFAEGISLFLEQTSQGAPLGVGSLQKQGQELIDFRNLDGTVRCDFSVYREAVFNNTVGFYLVNDEKGTVDGLAPGDSGYAAAAINNRLSDIALSVFDNGVNEVSDDFTGSAILVPFVITNGTAEQFLLNNASNSINNEIVAYFPFLGANPDRADHIRLLANNTFGFEDLPNGGDNDFNDLIIEIDIAQI